MVNGNCGWRDGFLINTEKRIDAAAEESSDTETEQTGENPIVIRDTTGAQSVDGIVTIQIDDPKQPDGTDIAGYTKIKSVMQMILKIL